MIRIKKKDGECLYRKIGGGSLRLGNKKIIKPGQTFYALPEDVKSFLLHLEVLDGGKVLSVEKTTGSFDKIKIKDKETIKKHTYTKEHKGAGWYNILDGNGKKMNEKSLKKVEVDKMLTQLREV